MRRRWIASSASRGEPFDTNTGLQNNDNRWYDASVGRWISPDPTGFTAGDTNEYRYVGNSPANATDPRGLAGEGKAFKEIIIKLTKEGVERKLYKIHHIIGHALFADARFAKFLSEIGIGKNLAKNLVARSQRRTRRRRWRRLEAAWPRRPPTLGVISAST